jgi:LysR family cyn operon transcriptional activator
MELRQIEYFMAVAAHQNFSRAAEHVHVSQPSLSVQIGGLERELGTRLFDRLGRKVVLTQAGELFHVHAERALRELDQAEQVVQELLGAKRGRLVVGALSTVNTYLIAPLVSRFKQRFPDIHLQVHAQASGDVVNGLLSNRLDIGICLLPLTHPQLTTVPLFEERLALVAPGRHAHCDTSRAHARPRAASPGPHAGRLLSAENGRSRMRQGRVCIRRWCWK